MKKLLIFELTPSIIDASLFEPALIASHWEEAYSSITYSALYDGIDTLFNHLKGLSLQICFITCLPYQFGQRILEHFHLCYHSIIEIPLNYSIEERQRLFLQLLKANHVVASDAVLFSTNKDDLWASNLCHIHSYICRWSTADIQVIPKYHYTHHLTHPVEVLTDVLQLDIDYSFPKEGFYSNWIRSQEGFRQAIEKNILSANKEWKEKRITVEMEATDVPFMIPFYYVETVCENPEFKYEYNTRLAFHDRIEAELDLLHSLHNKTIATGIINKLYDTILAIKNGLKNNPYYGNTLCVKLIDQPTNPEDQSVFYSLKKELNNVGIECRYFQKTPLMIEEHISTIFVDLCATEDRVKEVCKNVIDLKESCFSSCGRRKLGIKCFTNVLYLSYANEVSASEYDHYYTELYERECKSLNQRLNSILPSEEDKEWFWKSICRTTDFYDEEVFCLQYGLTHINEIMANHYLRDESKKYVVPINPSVYLTTPFLYRLTSGLRYFCAFNYYPTNADIEISEQDWTIRRLIWNFKNAEGRVSDLQHKDALNKVVSIFQTVLKTLFRGSHLWNVVFACVPASTAVDTERRYKEFSTMLCDTFGMINAYDYIKVLRDGSAKHTGGTEKAVIRLDSSCFKNKTVIIFDDIITKGKTLTDFQKRIEAAGGTVILALAIGKTQHQRQDYQPYFGSGINIEVPR